MISLLLLSLSAVLISGVPTPRHQTPARHQCQLLHQIMDRVNAWKNDSRTVNVTEFVEELKQEDANNLHCEKRTLCKAERILRNLTPVVNSTLNGVLGALNAYNSRLGHHWNQTACAGHNPTLTRMREFLLEVADCSKQLYNNC